jgi:hypothetical protein
MNAIESQRRMRMAAQEKAEADKILVVKAAEAESEAKYLSGTAICTNSWPQHFDSKMRRECGKCP